jgi:hypothetical protein
MGVTEDLLSTSIVTDHRRALPHHSTKKWTRRMASEIKGLVVHQSLEEHGTASGNAKYHVGPNHISDTGLPGLAYTLFIEKSGVVLLANDLEDVTYSQGTLSLDGDENRLYMSICVGGNFSGPGYVGSQEPTDDQILSLRQLWVRLKDLFKWDNSQLFGHYHFGKPACPGFALMKYVDAVNTLMGAHLVEAQLVTIPGRQDALKKLGFWDTSVDEFGSWGPESKGALMKYQKAHQLKVDGVWGRYTETSVRAELAKRKDTEHGS